MKKTALLLGLISTTFVGKAQNLVPNGDFEQYSSCPDNFSQLDTALFWINPTDLTTGSSPDYFNQCTSNNYVSVPQNNFGSQQAHSGNGYCGGILWYGPNPGYRENFETSLTAPLSANQCYHFEMYVALAEASEYTTSSIGVYFSDTLVSGINSYLPLPFIPQITNATGFIADTINWTFISGNYTATGGENYLIIANFYNDANTPTQFTNFGFFSEAYVYIDDVSLTPCTGIEEQNIPNFENLEYLIYPNPAKDELFINGYSLYGEEEIIITDVSARKVLTQSINGQISKINIQSLKSGIYFIEINGSNPDSHRGRKKFVKR